MLYSLTSSPLILFLCIACALVGLSFLLARSAKSAHGYYVARGHIPWPVNGVAFAGDYLSIATFLAVCGSIAFAGEYGFLTAVGLFSGWIVALLLFAGPMKRLGKLTLADVLDPHAHSPGIRLAAAISTVLICFLLLIPALVGAGELIQPLLGFPFSVAVALIGIVIILIVASAGMIAATWIQFIQGTLLFVFCILLTALVLHRGLLPKPANAFPRTLSTAAFAAHLRPDDTLLRNDGPWSAAHYARVRHADGSFTAWRYAGMNRLDLAWAAGTFTECQVVATSPDGATLIDGLPQTPDNDLHPISFIHRLPNNATPTGPLGPLSFLAAFQQSDIVMPFVQTLTDANGRYTIYASTITPGADLLAPSASTLFGGNTAHHRLNFLSLMLTLFFGAAVLPHLIIRHNTVKSPAAARQSTAFAVVLIGLLYILALYLGLGAMTSGLLDPSRPTLALPLLAQSFSPLLFTLVSAFACTLVLGAACGLLIAAAGTIAHDFFHHVLHIHTTDRAKVREAQIAAVFLGLLAILLAIACQNTRTAFLVPAAFALAAAAHFPALTMRLLWKRTTPQGILASITVGAIASLLWIALSPNAYEFLYHLPAASAPMPFNQPPLITLPIAYLTLIFVSLATPAPQPS